MHIDLELYRKDIRLPVQPPLRLSVIDISPEQPRRTLIFLHGFGGQASQWVYQLRHFSAEDRVIALDLRGHGHSEKPGGSYSMAHIQADLEAALDVLGVAGKFVLLGHSFGGAVAAEYAAAHPQRIEALVLIAAAGEYRLNPLYRLALRLPLPLLRLANPLVRGWLSAPPHALQAWYLHNLSQWNGWSLFRGLSVPTLVIRGHLDLVLERPSFEEVVRVIPGAEEIDVGASGHMVMLERREAVNRAIERFIQAQGQPEDRSWRQATLDREARTRAALVKARPWLNHYDEGIPYTAAIPRIPLHSLLHSAVRRFPRRTAIFFEGSRLNYRQLGQQVERFALALRRLGVEKGDRVMLFLPNLPQMVIAFYGTLQAGAVAVFSLPTTQPDELLRQVQDSGARLLVTLAANADLARQAMRGSRQAIDADDLPSEAGIAPGHYIIFADPAEALPPLKRLLLRLRPAGVTLPGGPLGPPSSSGPPSASNAPTPLDAEELTWASLLSEFGQPGRGAAEPAFEEPAANELAVIQYTGGTTADPKGVMLSHHNLVANALQTRYWMPQARDGHERFLCVLPFSHSYGLTTALNVPIAIGATLILKTGFQVAEVLKTIRRTRPTIFPGVPRMYMAINDFPSVRKYGISSIQACISGSAPLPVEVQEAFEKLTRGRLVEGYGLTEAAPVTHANPLHGLRKVGSIGIPLPSTEAKVVDLARGREAAARPVPAGHIGELAVRGPQVMMGYWQNPEATQEVLTTDGWLLTGDVAQADEEGYCRIISRKADMWYMGRPGKPAFPRDVEEVLFEVPQVKEAAVVAVAGQPVAFVIARLAAGGLARQTAQLPDQRPSADALIAYCKRRLPPELVPRLVIFLDDFPRTFIGKVLRRELARRFEESKRSEPD